MAWNLCSALSRLATRSSRPLAWSSTCRGSRRDQQAARWGTEIHTKPQQARALQRPPAHLAQLLAAACVPALLRHLRLQLLHLGLQHADLVLQARLVQPYLHIATQAAGGRPRAA